MTIAALAGPSALIAAAATVVGAVFLGLFFWKGGFWGPLNDLASIVMMLATIPVALLIGDAAARQGVGVLAGVATGIGIVGMLGASVAQGLLLARVRTYRQLLPWTLGFGAVVGIWYVLAGVLGTTFGLPGLPLALAIAAGAGYLALGYGFWRGNEQHPLSIVGGIVLLVASTGFLGWIALITVGSGPASPGLSQ